MADLDIVGRMLAYLAAGKTFEDFITEQGGEGVDQAELQTSWKQAEKWRKDNPGVAMAIPFD